MNLALSNFAWNSETQDLCFEILKQNNIKNVEIVFNKIKNKFILEDEEILNYHTLIKSYGLNIYSAQSLFYNTPVNNISEINIILDTVARLINYSKLLDIKILVFGSPTLRKRIPNWEQIIQTIFIGIDNMLKNTDIVLVIEPNSKIYNAEFFNNIDEIISFIQNNKLSNIKTMIDTHNLIYEKVSPIEVLNRYKEYIYHIHISEEKLLPLYDIEFHRKFSEAINNINYDKVITYEVNDSASTFESISTFSNIYLKNKN